MKSFARTQGSLRRTAAVAASALALTGALAGCGAQNGKVAATVGDRTITEAQVDETMSDLARSDLKGQVTRRDVLTGLMLAPYVADYLKGQGKAISADQAMAQALPTLSNPSATTKEFVQFNAGASTLQSEGVAAVMAKFKGAPVDVNPRYGTLDLTTQSGWVKDGANWMVPSAAPATPAP